MQCRWRVHRQRVPHLPDSCAKFKSQHQSFVPKPRPYFIAEHVAHRSSFRIAVGVSVRVADVFA